MGEILYGDGSREAPNGRFACMYGQMVLKPTTGPWVHFEDWVESEQKREAAALESKPKKPPLTVKTKPWRPSPEVLFYGTCAAFASIFWLLLLALMLHFVIETYS